MRARAAAVAEICEVESGECTESKTTAAIEWLFRRRFSNGETSLEDEPFSGLLHQP